MTIMRVEGVTFGVEDPAECTRFLGDMGLQQDPSSTPDRIIFRTPVNQFVRLVSIASTEFPAPVDSGSTLREITWGVDDQKALESLHQDLATDHRIRVSPSGSIHTVDPIGFGVAFMLTRPQIAHPTPPSYNFHRRHAPRVNDLPIMPTRACPLELIHVAVDIPKAVREAARAFYIDRLRFKPTDDAQDIGVFMQSEGDLQHHNWFMCHRTDKAGINHLAFEVPDFDSLILSAEYMIEKGWRESRRLGRHLMGSNVFRFIQSPCGGRIEYAWDMDRMDKNFQTRTYDQRPGHTLWMLKGVGGRGAQ